VTQAELLYDRTIFLANCFTSIPEDELLTIAEHLIYHSDFRSLSSRLTNNSLIWPVHATIPSGRVHIQYDGKISEAIVNEGLSNNVSYYSLSLSAAEDFNYQYPVSSLEIYKYINTNEL
jgi:hypothetical protein